KQLRSAVYGIMKYYVQRNIHIEELNALISSISTFATSNDIIAQELLEFILVLLYPPSISTDETIGFLCEPDMIKSFYVLLTIDNLTPETKEIVLKIIKCLMNSQPVRTQSRLDTNQIGFGGIIARFAPEALTTSFVRELFDVIITSDSSIDVNQVNMALQRCSTASLDVRYVALHKLMACFVADASVCRSYANSQGWQETLTHFFVKFRDSMSMKTSIADLSTDSGRESFYDSSARSSVANTSENLEDVADEQLLRQFDLSPTTTEYNLTIVSQTSSSDSAVASIGNTNDDLTSMSSCTGDRESNERAGRLASEIRLILGEFIGATSTMNSSSSVASWANPKDDGLLEEFYEILILIIVMLLWNGITGSDNEAWTKRGQVFAALRHLDHYQEFYLPLVCIEQRILELCMEACLNDLKINGGTVVI
ncbi:unnamed protein product, partial [Rotaria magnacalcarata]